MVWDCPNQLPPSLELVAMHCLSYLERPIGVADSPVGVRYHPLWTALQHAQTHSIFLPMSSSPQTITSGNTHAVVFNVARDTLDSPLSPSSYEDVHTGSATAVQSCAEFCKDTCAQCIVQQNSRRRSMIAVIVFAAHARPCALRNTTLFHCL